MHLCRFFVILFYINESVKFHIKRYRALYWHCSFIFFWMFDLRKYVVSGNYFIQATRVSVWLFPSPLPNLRLDVGGSKGIVMFPHNLRKWRWKYLSEREALAEGILDFFRLWFLHHINDVINFCFSWFVTYDHIFFREKYFLLSRIYIDLLHPILHHIAPVLSGMLFEGHLHILLSYPAILHLVIWLILGSGHVDAFRQPLC